MSKSIGLIEDETVILPFMIADSVHYEAMKFTERELDWDALKEHLCERAQECYAGNADFRRKIKSKGNTGRDTLYSFMRHWSAGWLLENGVPRKDINKDFCNGLKVN